LKEGEGQQGNNGERPTKVNGHYEEWLQEEKKKKKKKKYQ
jgi:hypothetical protein